MRNCGKFDQYRGSIQGKKKGVLEISGKITVLRTRNVPKVFTFDPTLIPRFPLKMTEIEKK